MKKVLRRFRKIGGKTVQREKWLFLNWQKSPGTPFFCRSGNWRGHGDRKQFYRSRSNDLRVSLSLFLHFRLEKSFNISPNRLPTARPGAPCNFVSIPRFGQRPLQPGRDRVDIAFHEHAEFRRGDDFRHASYALAQNRTPTRHPFPNTIP